ncbi:MAG TPA: hypothetical protein VM077_00645 [Candidatus Limnocylindrales bacterium]|nr:hypothetical protein [Candidatus Limnocylindrales bacterium]
MDNLTPHIDNNLDTGRKFIFGMTDQLYGDWLDDVQRRYNEDPDDQTTLFLTIYRTHSALIVGGDWSYRTIMDNTFSSAGREIFDWVIDYPDMDRDELEEIARNSTEGIIEQAGQLGIKSTAIEGVVMNVAERGELAYVLDADKRKIIFNPEFNDDVVREEERRREEYPDQTQLVLGCPAKFVPSTLYPRGSMLHDLIRFKASVYTEIYLATHNRRAFTEKS